MGSSTMQHEGFSPRILLRDSRLGLKARKRFKEEISYILILRRGRNVMSHNQKGSRLEGKSYKVHQSLR
jgi:hypothetical protein